MNASGENFSEKNREYAIIGAGKPPPGLFQKTLNFSFQGGHINMAEMK